MDFSKISLIIGLLLSLANIANWIYKYFNGAYKIKKNNEDLHIKVDKHEQEIIQIKESQTAIVLGVQAILKNNLKELHREYMGRESITSDEFDNFKTQYEAYHGCGGNGTGTRYYEDICEKPIVD